MTIQNSLKKLSATQEEVYSKVCVVRSTSKYFLLIDVEPIDSLLFNLAVPNKDNYIRNVKLSPITSALNKSQSYKIPKVGSYVIVTFLSKELGFVALFSKLTTVVIAANDIKIQLTDAVKFDNIDAFNINNSENNILNIEDFDDITNITISNINSILLDSNNNTILLDKDNISIKVKEDSRIAIHKFKVETIENTFDVITETIVSKKLNETLKTTFYNKIKKIREASEWGLSFAITNSFKNSKQALALLDSKTASFYYKGIYNVNDYATYNLIGDYMLCVMAKLYSLGKNTMKFEIYLIKEYLKGGIVEVVITTEEYDKFLKEYASNGIVLSGVETNYTNLRKGLLGGSIRFETLDTFINENDVYNKFNKAILPKQINGKLNGRDKSDVDDYYIECLTVVNNENTTSLNTIIDLYDKDYIDVFYKFIRDYVKLLEKHIKVSSYSASDIYTFGIYYGFNFNLSVVSYVNDIVRGFTGSELANINKVFELQEELGSKYFKNIKNDNVENLLIALENWLNQYSIGIIKILEDEFAIYENGLKDLTEVVGVTNSYTTYKEVNTITNSLYDILIDLNKLLLNSSVIDNAIPITYTISPVIIEKLNTNKADINKILKQ